MPRHKNKQSGFTLIELLVVISIIGLLSSVLMVATTRARVKARDSQRVSNMKQMATALELYYSDNNQFPTSMSDSYGATNFSIFPSWDQLGADLAPYMASVPHDPSEPARYIYYFSGPQATWCLPAGGEFLRISQDTGFMLVTYLEDPYSTLPQNDGGIYADRYEIIGGDARRTNTCP